MEMDCVQEKKNRSKVLRFVLPLKNHLLYSSWYQTRPFAKGMRQFEGLVICLYFKFLQKKEYHFRNI